MSTNCDRLEKDKLNFLIFEKKRGLYIFWVCFQPFVELCDGDFVIINFKLLFQSVHILSLLLFLWDYAIKKKDISDDIIIILSDAMLHGRRISQRHSIAPPPLDEMTQITYIFTLPIFDGYRLPFFWLFDQSLSRTNGIGRIEWARKALTHT